MKQIVYIDMLLSVNLLTDYILMRAAAMLAGRICSRLRLCAASVLGAACSLVILLPPQPFWIRLAIAAVTAALMTLAGPGFGDPASYLKTCGCLLLVTCCYGGIMNCVWTFFAPRGMIVNNGAVYLDIRPTALIISAGVFYAAVSLSASRLRKRTLERSACRVEITRDGRSVTVDAIFDTGNLLCEPFSGLPVIIAEKEYIESVVPPGIDSFIGGSAAGGAAGIRVVPYSSVGGGGLMAAFKPDGIRVYTQDGVKTAEAYIGVSESELGGHCRAVINPDAIL